MITEIATSLIPWHYEHDLNGYLNSERLALCGRCYGSTFSVYCGQVHVAVYDELVGCQGVDDGHLVSWLP